MSKSFSTIEELTSIVKTAQESKKTTVVYVHSETRMMCLSVANTVDDWATEYEETLTFATLNLNDENAKQTIEFLNVEVAPTFVVVTEDNGALVKGEVFGENSDDELQAFFAANKPSVAVVDPIRHVTTEAELDAVLGEAKEGDKIVLIDFYADWCPPCIKIAPAFKALARSNDHPRVIFVKIDVDEAAEIEEKFQIRCMPTFIALQPSQSETDLVFYLEGAELAFVEEFLTEDVRNKEILEVAERPEVSDDEWSDDEDEEDEDEEDQE